MAAPAGRFIYKMLPTRSKAGVITIPLTFPLPMLADDARDGFIHLSTAPQVEYVLDRFYKQEDSVVVVKFDRRKLEPFKPLKWEGDAAQGGPFPHLYGADLEQSEVDKDGVRQVEHEPGQPWRSVLASLQSWLE